MIDDVSQPSLRDVIDVHGDAGGDSQPAETAVASLTEDEIVGMTDGLVAAFKTVFDPEIPVDIYELGLIYRVDISDDRLVTIDMTLTAPGCPVAGDLPVWVERAARGVEGVRDVKVNMVFDPPWDMSRMSDEARLQLNML
jgi:FeS assembly SUF system protein